MEEKKIFEFAIDKFLKHKIELMIKRITDDDENDNYLIIEGDTGCLAGDSIIRYNRGHNCRKMTIRKLFNHYHNPIPNKNKRIFDLSIPTFIRAYNGIEIKLHKLKDVFYSGKKKVFKLILEDGKSIKATEEHKFLTPLNWKELKDLKVGDTILCDTPKPTKNGRMKVKLKEIQLTAKYHPYKDLHGGVSVPRLIYEARLNNLEFLQYLDILLNEPNHAKTLKYINPSIHSVHHKDGCHYNNSIENLQLMLNNEHLKLHGESNYVNFSQGVPKHIKIKEIIEGEIEDTYDIECEEPYHNFIANDIIVHNSGKTNMSIGISYLVAQATGRTFDNSRIFFDTAKAVDFAKTTKEQIIIFDEPAFGGLKAEWRKKTQIDLIKLLYTARIKRHFVIFNLVKFSKFNDDIIEKAVALIRIYKRNETMKERRFLYIPHKRIPAMLDYWHRKHIRNYIKFAISHGTVFKYVLPEIINKDEYNKIKEESISMIGEDEKKDKHKEKEALLQLKILNAFPKMKARGINLKMDDYCKIMDISTATPTNWRDNLGKLGLLLRRKAPDLELSELVINKGLGTTNSLENEDVVGNLIENSTECST